MEVDKYSKEQATEYANNEAEMLGFAVGSLKWKACFKEYIDFAKGTMNVGRNPRMMMRNPIKAIEGYYGDILSSSGLAGRLARNYRSPEGKGVPLEAVQNRIMSSVTNLVKLFENAELGTKTTTTGRGQGKIDNNNMSELQMPTKFSGQSDAYREAAVAVIKKQMTRDLLTNIILESLVPFFELKKKDIDDLMATFDFKTPDVSEFHKEGVRKSWIDALRGVVGKKFSTINYRKILFGD